MALSPDAGSRRLAAPWRRWATALAVLGAALGLVWAFQPMKPAPVRVLVLPPPPDPGDGLAPEEREAFQDLLAWELEADGGFTVLQPAGPPSPRQLKSLPAATRVVEVRPRRSGDGLALVMRTSTMAEIRSRADGGWQSSDVAAGVPAAALNEALRRLSLGRHLDLPPGSVPREPARFWALMRAMGWNRREEHLPEACGLARSVAEAEPGCGLAPMVWADGLYRWVLEEPRRFPRGQMEVQSLLQRTLVLRPGYPQATYLLSQLLTDAGDQRAALDTLQRALDRTPQVPSLHAGVAYAARTAGLLQLARRALERRDALVPQAFRPVTSENTFLYLGDWARFEASLVEEPGEPANAGALFYRGYVALARGRAQEAADWFDRAHGSAQAYAQFGRLAEIFAAVARGRKAEGRALLAVLDRDREGMAVPDGEFTFKLAEAHALLEEPQEALDMAGRAFSQGFSCTSWYEGSPFLAPLRGLPRWRWLVQHLRERQRLLEERFPEEAFE